ncbi:unnamed protein product [Brugia timori]|uniref:Uncharacterized protein n=1 Tax=Brugia timori TaxID=42155 RepID=A0A0R3QFM2_9BILA|nr:unnamed protein product [Brugia timori]
MKQFGGSQSNESIEPILSPTYGGLYTAAINNTITTAPLPPISKTAHTLPSRLAADRALISPTSGLFPPENSHMRPTRPPLAPSSIRFGDISEISKPKQNQRIHEQPKVLISSTSSIRNTL